jgi:phosphoribosylformylglycinamidine cyclo-ligase
MGVRSPLDLQYSEVMDSYKAAGVDYDVLDAGKRAAVARALESSEFSSDRGVRSLDESRGESAFVYQLGDRYLAQVMEGLGTKSIIARAVQEATGRNLFAAIGYDSVAAIVNDLISVGALPLVVNAYFATGSPDWYGVQGRHEALVHGWFEACRDSGATWGGGESPGLSGIVLDGEIDLAGCASGAVPIGHSPILGADLSAGDEIVFVASTGLHANGASLARKLASTLPNGYQTAMPNGEEFGEALLAPTAIYVDVVDRVLSAGLPITYMSHITGHGFRKVMRANRELTYRITDLPAVPPVLTFLAEQTNMSETDAYGTFNMGAGFALYCKPGAAGEIVALAKECDKEAWVVGAVEAGERQVIIEPKDITFTDESLQLR